MRKYSITKKDLNFNNKNTLILTSVTNNIINKVKTDIENESGDLVLITDRALNITTRTIPVKKMIDPLKNIDSTDKINIYYIFILLEYLTKTPLTFFEKKVLYEFLYKKPKNLEIKEYIKEKNSNPILEALLVKLRINTVEIEIKKQGNITLLEGLDPFLVFIFLNNIPNTSKIYIISSSLVDTKNKMFTFNYILKNKYFCKTAIIIPAHKDIFENLREFSSLISFSSVFWVIDCFYYIKKYNLEDFINIKNEDLIKLNNGYNYVC